MCGICGFVRLGSERSLVERQMGLRALVKAMTAAQRHRGPDNEGTFVEETQRRAVALGHNRLSILDLSPKANQPMGNEDGSIWVIFNGEIYNYRALRHRLIKKGHRFVSSSDTEILVHGYEEWGTNLFPRLDGIFAFAIWDNRSEWLVLCRDYFGVKPLHYHLSGNVLRFSSEIKAMLADKTLTRAINKQAVHSLMNLRYNVSKETLFKGIFRVRPGCFGLFKEGRLHFQRYATPLPPYDPFIDENTAQEEVRRRMITAVEKQLVSDVPVGISLSSGLDSSSLLAIRAKILGEQRFHSFTLGFSSERDEMAEAEALAGQFNTNQHSFSSSTHPLTVLPLVIWHLEEPKVNAIQNMILTRFISQHVKVVFSGLGGDELFVGYNLHRFIQWGRYLGNFLPPILRNHTFTDLRRRLIGFQRNLAGLSLDETRRGLQMALSAGDPTRFYLIPRNAWDGDRQMWTDIYHPAFLKSPPRPIASQFRRFFRNCEIPDLDRTLRAEFWTKMIDDLLLNEDRMSMANGVESRVPLLDKDLVHFAFSIPPDVKMQKGATKYLLKSAMQDILPPHVLERRKTGFQFSAYQLFKKNGLRKMARDLLTEEVVESRQMFNYQYIKRIVDAPPRRSMRWHYFFLLLLVGLEYWFRLFIDQSMDVSAEDLSNCVH